MGGRNDIMSGLTKSPVFWLGIFIRCILLATMHPVDTNKWFAPFLELTGGLSSLDPWGLWLRHGGDPAAFPYGYAMWIFFLPLTILCKVLRLPVVIGYSVTLIFADIGLLQILQKMLPGKDRLLLLTYWLSPIVLLATYCFGFNDLIPVLLLATSLFYTRKYKLCFAGFFCAAAISAKLSMLLALPFFCIYLLRNRALFQLALRYILGIGVGAFAFVVPFLFSASGLRMLFGNPEISKIFQMRLMVGPETTVFVLPMVYMGMLYAAWRVHRINFHLFNCLLGNSFLVVVILTPASPGWFIWVLPLLMFYQSTRGRVATGLILLFFGLYLASNLVSLSFFGADFVILNEIRFMAVSQFYKSEISSLLHTAMMATGIVLVISIWRDTVSNNDYFLLSRKPFVIGIAGDSGSGKDTLARSLQGLFGNHSVAHLSGDNYHLWDRHKPMWQFMTHLNPRANDLEGFGNDLITLIHGRPVHTGHYDHKSGKMSRPGKINPNDFIVASGLHSLYRTSLRECYDIAIYLDIDEGLRKFYKINRDTNERGQTVPQVLNGLFRRESDSAKFIRPQIQYATVVFSLRPAHPQELTAPGFIGLPRTNLFVQSRSGVELSSMIRILVGICGLHVDRELGSEFTTENLSFDGDLTSQDVAFAALNLFPQILDFLDIAPRWDEGMLGLMQLITLAHINQSLKKRLLA